MEPSEAQRKAIECIDKPCIISAGAGSGKTFALTSKFSHLVKKNYDPEKILCITFTNKAASELKERVVKLTHINFYELKWVRTIHSACLQMLKPYLYKIDYNENVSIYTGTDQRRILRGILKSRSINPKEFIMPLSRMVSNAKDHKDAHQFIRMEMILKHYGELTNITPYRDKVRDLLVDIFEEYNTTLKTYNALDFDDILWHTYKLLRDDSEFRNYYKNLFQYILVDEFQDVNYVQYNIILLLASNNNLTIVGDDFQAIFGWRGAKSRFFIDFKNKIKDTKLFKLEQNYRSTDKIVEMSNDIIKNNSNQINKTCYSKIKSAVKPRVIKFNNDEMESSSIAKACIYYATDENYSFNDIAVLYRAKFNSRGIEKALTDLVIPYTVIGAVAFFERREVRGLLSYLLFSLNKNDNESFLRSLSTPRKGIGNSSIQKIQKTKGENILHKIENGINQQIFSRKISQKLYSYMVFIYKLHTFTPVEAIMKVIEFTNYENFLKSTSIDEEDFIDKKENVQELINFASKFNNVPDFIDESSLMVSRNNEEDKVDRVKLMTIHAAKGLEFKVIFVIGLEDGLIPHWKALKQDKELKTDENLEEERRLFYVATTRAADILNLTFVGNRSCSFANRKSRFIREIEDHCDFVNMIEKE